MFTGARPLPNKQFKPPSIRQQPAGNPISVPAPNGRSREDRRDASSSNQQENEFGGFGGRQHNRPNQPYGHPPPQHHRSSYADGNSLEESTRTETIGLVDDFDDGDGPKWQKPDLYQKEIADKRAKALARDQRPKAIAEPPRHDKLDDIHANEERLMQQEQAERAQREKVRRAREEKEATAKKLGTADLRKQAAARDARPSISSLPSSKRKNLTKPSAKDQLREQSASAAERRARQSKSNSDDIEDADAAGTPQFKLVKDRGGSKGKGKGKARQEYVDLSTPEAERLSKSTSDNHTAMLDSLLMPVKTKDPWGSSSSNAPKPSSSSVGRGTVIEVDADDDENDSDPHVKAAHRRPTPPPKSPTPERVDLKAMINQDREAEETTSDDDEEATAAIARALVSTQAARKIVKDTHDPLLSREEAPVDPSSLCPFCSTLLPKQPSKALADLLAYLLDQPHIINLPTARNPLAKRLPVTETATFCRLHEEERTVIPDGEKRGWPTQIDWTGLPKRIDRQLSQHLSDVITGRQPCSFLDGARVEWDAKGVKMKNLLSEYGSFDIEQPGYYGSRGHEVIVATLTKLFITNSPILTALRAAPLDPPSYIRRVLVPETAMQLIKADLSLPDDDAARDTLRKSRAFGRAMFPGGLEGREEEAKFVREEEAKERVEEEEGSQERTAATKAASKDKSKRRERMTNEERSKEKRREEKRKKQEMAARALEVKKKLSVMDGTSSDGEADAAPRRRPRAGGSSSPEPVAAAPAKRKPKQQLVKERKQQQASTASSVVGAGASDSDELEVVVKRKKPRPRPPPSPELSIVSKSASFTKPRSKAATSSSDEPLPRANGKTIARTASTSAAKHSTAMPSSSSRFKSSKSSKSAPTPKDGSDSDSFLNDEITTNVRKKKQLAPWEKGSKSSGKGAKGKTGKKSAAVDDSDPSPPPSSDSEMDLD